MLIEYLNKMSLDELNEPLEFTKCVLEDGDPTKQVKDGQLFNLKIKFLFNPDLIANNKYSSHDLETLIGFECPKEKDDYVNISMKLGYFKSQISKIIHRAVTQMYLNQKIHLSFEYSPLLLDEALQQRKNYIHQNSDVYLDLKFEMILTEIASDQTNSLINTKIYDMTDHDFFILANEHKTEANELYLKNMIHTAFDRYQKSISYVIIAQQTLTDRLSLQAIKEVDEERMEEENHSNSLSDDELKNRLKVLKSQLYSNIAACQLKSFNFKMVIVNCNKCLELEPNNVKAIFRRSQAFMNLNEYDKSIEDMNRALKIDAENKEIKQKLVQVEAMKKEYKQQMINKMRKLFS